MTDRQRKPMTISTVAAILRGLASELDALKADRAERETERTLNDIAIVELDRRIVEKRAQLASARKGRF
jgi:hypothetical protein